MISRKLSQISTKFPFHFRHKVIDFAKIDSYLQKTLKSTFKGVVFNYCITILYSNSLNHKNFTYNILNEALITNEIVFYFTRNFYLVYEINEKVSHLKSGGFINYLMSKYLSKDFTKKNVLIESLSMKQLHGIFQILMYGLLLALVVFFMEMTWKLFKKFFNRCMGLRR